MSRKVQELVTRKIVEMIEQAEKNGETMTWTKGWTSTPHQGLKSRHVYRGVNALVTTLAALVDGDENPRISGGQGQATRFREVGIEPILKLARKRRRARSRFGNLTRALPNEHRLAASIAFDTAGGCSKS